MRFYIVKFILFATTWQQLTERATAWEEFKQNFGCKDIREQVPWTNRQLEGQKGARPAVVWRRTSVRDMCKTQKGGLWKAAMRVQPMRPGRKVGIYMLGLLVSRASYEFWWAVTLLIRSARVKEVLNPPWVKLLLNLLRPITCVPAAPDRKQQLSWTNNHLNPKGNNANDPLIYQLISILEAPGGRQQEQYQPLPTFLRNQNKKRCVYNS